MRSPATVLLSFSVLFVTFARCQSPELIVEGQTGKLYLEHTVVAKENWYSVGRLYNISPKILAPYNERTLAHPLIIGQTLRIPLTAANFSQKEVKTPAETLVPVYYVVREKEWMYRISVNHNKVPIPDLEKWNHITGDQIHPGLHVIVGFLKVRTALSALARTPRPMIASTATPVPAGGPVPAAGDVPVTAARTETPAGTTARTETSGATATQSTSAEPAQARHETPPSPVTRPVSGAAPNFDGGVFRSDFSDEGHSAGGLAAIFKSTSGWQDGKYYALMNNVTVGTIVKVTDHATGKSVYAKVLGQLPEMKESAGLTVRLSNAAAAELGEGEERFSVDVSY